jgi:AraC family transcriptional regulator
MQRMPTSKHIHDVQGAADEEALIRAHLAAVAWIEKHLFEPMTVKSIADRVGYSPSRFSRGFTRLQGESVMSYVRGRRLEAAARRLLTDPEVRIVDLAFDSGFDSQEAFTRAFSRAFGHPPGRLRSLGPVRSMMRRKKMSPLEPEIHERVEQVPELHLAGLVRRVTPANALDVVDLWRRLESMRASSGTLDSSTYSLILDIDRRDGATEMMAALRIRPDGEPPPQLRRHLFPGGTYAVFRHIVRKGDVYPQIIVAREATFSHYLPRLPQASIRFPYLEVYPQGISVTPGSWVDRYFPLEESSQ